MTGFAHVFGLLTQFKVYLYVLGVSESIPTVLTIVDAIHMMDKVNVASIKVNVTLQL